MRRFLLFLSIAMIAVFGVFSYERLIVEDTFGPAAVFAVTLLGFATLLVVVSFLLSSTRHWDRVRNTWLVLLSVSLTYVTMDVIAGIVLIRPLSPPLVPDLERHHRLVPDSHSRLQHRDYTYEQRINNLGLRGRDLSLRKPAGTFRILMLGDSFTMGKGVNDDQTFSVLLENILNGGESICGYRSFEVVNGGVDSYAPVLSYIQLRNDLAQLDPDLVILNLDNSDLGQEQAYRRIAEYGEDGDVLRVPQVAPEDVSLSERLRRWTEQHLYMTRLILYYLNRLFGYSDLSVREAVTQAKFESVAHTLAGDTVDRANQWAQLFDSILRIKAFADSHDFAFALSIYPWGHQVSDKEWPDGRINFMPAGSVASDKSMKLVQELARRHSIELINLFPMLRAYRGTEPLYFRHDNHWAPAGHRVVADAYADFLRSKYATARCSISETRGTEAN